MNTDPETSTNMWSALQAQAWQGMELDLKAIALAFTDPAGEMWPTKESYREAVDIMCGQRPNRIRKRAPSSF
jgi:hypothetical protein